MCGSQLHIIFRSFFYSYARPSRRIGIASLPRAATPRGRPRPEIPTIRARPPDRDRRRRPTGRARRPARHRAGVSGCARTRRREARADVAGRPSPAHRPRGRTRGAVDPHARAPVTAHAHARAPQATRRVAIGISLQKEKPPPGPARPPAGHRGHTRADCARLRRGAHRASPRTCHASRTHTLLRYAHARALALALALALIAALDDAHDEKRQASRNVITHIVSLALRGG